MQPNYTYAIFSGSTLKILAMLAMLVDHIGAVFFPTVTIFRIIGRIAFPIFCFLLTEGFIHTRNLKKYLLRLGCFALISEVPFDLAFFNTLFYPWHQNVFFTLFIGLTVLALYKKYINHLLLSALIVLCGCLIPSVLYTDYGALGIFTIMIFYFFKESKLITILILLIANYLFGGPLQAFATLGLIPILLYNGQKGYNLKYIFYLFYPVHLIILYGINQILT